MVTKTVLANTTLQQRHQIVAVATKEPIWTHAALAKGATAHFKRGSPIYRATISKVLKRDNKINLSAVPSDEVKDDVCAFF